MRTFGPWPAGNPIEAAGFRQGLEEVGYIEGRNILVEYRFGEGSVDRSADLVTELARLRPDLRRWCFS